MIVLSLFDGMACGYEALISYIVRGTKWKGYLCHG